MPSTTMMVMILFAEFIERIEPKDDELLVTGIGNIR